MSPGRGVRPSPVAAVALLLSVVAACSSPNRGTWKGTFSGTVSGTVEFEINARGTRVKGKMEGATVSGDPFRATLEGVLRQDFFRADFEGSSRTSVALPLAFEGQMMGSLEGGHGTGDWSAVIQVTGSRFHGTWSVEQTSP